jgi:hypothetical protein
MFDPQQSFEWNKQKAYSGKLGRERELFCFQYSKQKSSIIKKLEERQLQEVESKHVQITCKKRCVHSSCCFEYVEANIQECETIVYYLYNHPQALKIFLKNYPEWRLQVSLNGDLHKEYDKILQSLISPSPSNTSQENVDAIFTKYHDFHIYCPFLENNECIIYDVRPYSCAGCYSSAAIDLCSVDSKWLPPLQRLLPDELLGSSFYCEKLKKPTLLFMPLNVYEIIMKGYAHIVEITGLTELEKEAKQQHLLTY